MDTTAEWCTSTNRLLMAYIENNIGLTYLAKRQAALSVWVGKVGTKLQSDSNREEKGYQSMTDGS